VKHLIEYLKVLADPTRMKIVKFLSEGDMYVCELAEALGTSQPCVSQHIRRLKGLGLVIERREGQRVCYRLDDGALGRHRDELMAFLDAPAREIPAMQEEWNRYCSSLSSDHILRCKRGCDGTESDECGRAQADRRRS